MTWLVPFAKIKIKLSTMFLAMIARILGPLGKSFATSLAIV
jgi:hypothetical protein